MNSNLVQVRRQDALALLRSLPDRSVPLVLTDPPYGISYQSNYRKGGKTAPIASDWSFEPAVFMEEIDRVLVDGGAAYVFTRWDVYPDWFRAVPKSLSVRNLIVWMKNNWSAGDLTGNFGAMWEGMMFFTKGRHQIRGHRHPNVWDFPRVSTKVQRHPAEKPIALLQRAIGASTDPGDLVVDPFCGSGSTAEAASLLGRRAIVGDTDPRWLREVLDRLGMEPNPDYADPEPSGAGDRDVEIDMSMLDGVHPDDVAEMVAGWRTRSDAAPLPPPDESITTLFTVL